LKALHVELCSRHTGLLSNSVSCESLLVSRECHSDKRRHLLCRDVLQSRLN
jgi:hypothetical protein